jgi:DNA-binding NtrC family response regulator
MPGKDGLTLLEDFRTLGITTPVVMISGQASIDMAVRATRLGAIDFLEKPLSTDKLLLTVANVLKKSLEEENRHLRQRVGKHEIIWKSDAMQRVMAQVERVAASETRVCILGETGTGKELIARTVHARSPRANGPFVTLNCAAIPAELIESELFGHEKGAFTGAATRHTGKFEQAQHGTLFLDEIGDMPPVMQTKLLRVLEENEIERVGGDRPVTVNVRVVVATHRNLEDLVKRGTFRQDLYHRIFVFPILLPPLRERWRHTRAGGTLRAPDCRSERLEGTSVSARSASRARALFWPGNVRELQHHRALTAAFRRAGGSRDGRSHIATTCGGLHRVAGRGHERHAGRARRHLRARSAAGRLKRHSYRMTETAKALGLERSHLYKKCQALGIDLQAVKKGESEASP